MALFQQTAGGACLQLELSGEAAVPPLRMVPDPRPADGGAETGQARVGRSLPPVEFSHYIVPGTGGHGRARADALLAVTRLFPCQVTVFHYDATRHDKFLIITGTRPVLDALDLLLPKIALAIEQAARTETGTYAKEVSAALPRMRQHERRSRLVIPFFRDYLRGYGNGAAEAIGTIRSGIVADAGADLAEDLAVQVARAAEASIQQFPDPQPLHEERAGHRGAFQAGLDAGRVAGFDQDYAAQHDLVFALI